MTIVKFAFLILSISLIFVDQSVKYCSCWPLISPRHGAAIHDLVGYIPEFALLANQWNIYGVADPSLSGPIYCSIYEILGQPGFLNNGGYFERIYTSLPPHSFITHQLHFLIADNWLSTDYFEVQIDNRPSYSFYPQSYKDSFGTNLCGDPSKNEIYDYYEGRVSHTSSSLTIRVTTHISNSPTNAWLAIRDFRIFLTNSTAITEYRCASSKTGVERCLCANGQYPVGSACLPCHATCEECFGPSDTDCYYCKGQTQFDGIRCRNPIFPTCQYYDYLDNKCERCSPPAILYWDGICKTNCISPNFIEELAGFRYCKTPCQNNNTFLLWSNNCTDHCDFPLIKRIEREAMFCDYPCNFMANEYLYSNGSCLTSCNVFNQSIGGRHFCNGFPDGTFFYPNATCLSACPFPRITRGENNYSYCISPCNSNQEYYYKKSAKCKLGCEYPNRIEDNIFCVLDLSDETISALNTLSNVLESAGHVNNITTTIARIVSFSNPFAFLYGSLGDIIMHIKYLKINYPPKLQYILDQPQSEGILQKILAIPEVVENCFVREELPETLQKYEIHSSFFVNFWQPYLNFAMIGGAIILVIILEFCFKKYKYVHSFLLGLKRALKWSFLISSWMGYFGELSFYTYLEIKSIKFGSFWSVLSFVACILTNLMAFVLIFRIFIILKEVVAAKSQGLGKQLTSRRVNSIKKKWKEYRITFESFKDDLLLKQSFLLIFIIRLYIFNIIITSLFEYALVQAIIITLLGIFMLGYLIIFRPFKEKKGLIENLVQESALMIVNICVLILALFDANNSEAFDLREILGDIILGVNTGFSLLGSIYINIQLILSLKGLFSKQNTNNATSLNRASIFEKEEFKEDNSSMHHDSSQDTLQKFTNSSISDQTRFRNRILRPYNLRAPRNAINNEPKDLPDSGLNNENTSRIRRRNKNLPQKILKDTD